VDDADTDEFVGAENVPAEAAAAAATAAAEAAEAAASPTVNYCENSQIMHLRNETTHVNSVVESATLEHWADNRLLVSGTERRRQAVCSCRKTSCDVRRDYTINCSCHYTPICKA
jgi:hypothetical protein